MVVIFIDHVFYIQYWVLPKIIMVEINNYLTIVNFFLKLYQLLTLDYMYIYFVYEIYIIKNQFENKIIDYISIIYFIHYL